MKPEIVSRNVGRCLTERKLKDFDAQVAKFAAFINVSQFDTQPDHAGSTDEELILEPKLQIGYLLYGVNGEDGSLTWLGEIIDSSD